MKKKKKKDGINPRAVITLHMPLKKKKKSIKASLKQFKLSHKLLNYLPEQIPTLLKGLKQNQALSNVKLKIPGMK